MASGTGLIAATYGLVRLAYGLFLPDVQAKLRLDTSEAGLISAGASVAYCLAALIGLVVVSRHSRSLVVAAALTASSGAAGMAASHHTTAFAMFAILGSAGGGLASPGLVCIVRRNVTAETNDRSQARVNAGTGPGLVAAGVLALMLLPNWRQAWSCVAVFTIVVAAAVLILDRGRDHDDAEGGGQIVPSWSWFVAHQHVIVAAFLMGAASSAVWNYGRTLLMDAGASEQASVSAWIALGLGGTASISTARLITAARPRTAWTATVLTVAVASATLGLTPRSTVIALVACAAFGWGYTAGTGALIAWTTLIDEIHAPAGTSLLFITLVLGQAVGATIIGTLMASAGTGAAFLTAGAIMLAAATAPLLWKSQRPARQPAPV